MPVARAAPPATPLYRVARAPDPLAWPDWRYIGGSRFDDPRNQFRVLYLAERRVGCFVESLAGFRLDVDLLARIARVSGASGGLPAPLVPRDWYASRRVGRLQISPGQQWLDLRAPETLQALRAELADALVRLHLPDMDVGATRGPSRALTREIARWAYDRGFRGLAYRSRFGDQIECWAVFEGASISPIRPDETILPDDPDLQAAAHLFGLTIET
ncbi:MAG: RES family NAD+ phosphorylase [Chloroflexota bacterium]